jgi:beta-phosphoglucomutase-like phosphatase (HAD superfamily)
MSFIRYLTCSYSDDYMNGLIFDLIDILIESMPVHHDPWEVAFDRAVNIEFDQRTNYLLEGMRRIGLVKNIFELNTFGLKRFDESRATQVTKSKYDLSKIFRVKFLERVSELVTNLVICTSKKDFESVLEQVLGFGKEQFLVIIIPDQVTKGSRLYTEYFKSLISERFVKHTRSAFNVL